MKNLVIKSYAKINLCLNVVGKREDGYHNLDMVMLPLELHDSVLFTELKSAPDHYVTIDDFSLGLFKYNTATTAINLLQEKYGFTNRFRVSIHKVIPMQAGLGGGSSNAATVINAVDKYLNLNMSEQEKIDIAVQVGADVPFFISSKPARCRGVGEKIDLINLKNDYYVLIVKPVVGCSTEKVFKLSDTMDLKIGNVEDAIKALEEGDDVKLAQSICNSLEPAAISFVPEIQVIIDKLKMHGLNIVQMSGSGSAVFAMSTDKKLIKNVAKELEKEYLVELTKVLK